MKTLPFLIGFLAFCSFAGAQTLDDAKKLYEEKQYSKALPIFRAEHDKTPTNVQLNRWLGICFFETGDYDKAEEYLLTAAKRNDAEAIIYLGDLYVLTYRFEQADEEYTKYQRAKRRDKEALEQLEAKLDYASQLEQLVRKVEDVQIIDSVVVNKADLLSAYKLSSTAGMLMPASEFFNEQQTNNDIAFLNERKEKVYYTRGDSASGVDLFSMERLLGNFGNEKRLPTSINTRGNEAYPFVMPDGMTIYFASTGHNSIGGYDLFVTRYNLSSDTYLNPSRLNPPFNSPFNDYMLAIDEELGVGWFASDRFQPEGSVCVYTFIPSREVKILESDDREYIARRARITSISESWRGGADYSSILNAVNNAGQVNVERSERRDFVFVINDEHTYHTISDFRNAQARDLFSRSLETKKQLDSLSAELDSRRQQFVKSGGDATLRTAILQLENRVEAVTNEFESLQIQARNEEVRSNYRTY